MPDPAAKKTKSFVSIISYEIQAFAENEILAAIPPDVLAKIKISNPHPFFKAYSICHDGVSKPTLLGDTAKPISWIRQSVESIKNIITKGVKFFAGHGDNTNDTTSREELGEVVADFQKDIDGKLHHVVIGYFPHPDKVKDFNVCSQEAEWRFWDDPQGWIATKIDKLTGIALANSQFEKPAFSGARELGFVQAFEAGETSHNKTGGDPGRNKKMTKEEVIVAVRELNLHPAQIFNVDDLKADREFGKLFTERETLEKTVKEKDEELKKLGESQKDINERLLKTTAQERINKITADKKATDKQKTYIEKRLAKCKDMTDDGLLKFVDEQLEDYKFNAEYLGVEKSEKLPTQTDTGNGAPDYTKAKDNPLLKSDL